MVEEHLLEVSGDEEMRLRVVAYAPPKITFDWFGGGRLEHGHSISGPWGPVGKGAPTDFYISNSGHQFFRIRR